MIITYGILISYNAVNNYIPLSRRTEVSDNAVRQFFHPKAVGRDSGVPFSLSNFLENILQSTKSKMSPT